MGLETVITAPTMAEALAKVREELGSDALILSHAESKGKVSITARSDINNTKKTEIPSWIRPLSPPSKSSSTINQAPSGNNPASTAKIHPQAFDQLKIEKTPADHLSKNEQIHIPTRRSDFKNIVNSASSFDETLTAISSICDLSEFHQLGDEVGEAWLRALNPEFSHTPMQLASALDRILPTDQMWLDDLSAERQAVLVGPPGSGKTVTIAKLAAMLLQRGKKLRVVTLDTINASRAWQLEEYLKPLSLRVYVGIEYVDDARPNEIMLIDTPALDINTKQDQNYLKTLKTKINVPYTLVLPADMNPIEAESVAHLFTQQNAQNLIVTRMELSKRCGVPLRAAYQGLKLVLTSKSPILEEGLQYTTPETMLQKMLDACGKIL